MKPQIIKLVFFTWIGLFSAAPLALAQQFGRNKIQYQNKTWEYIQSEHFDVFYYQGGRRLAEFAASVSESSYVSLKRTFNYELLDRIPVLIYRSHNDFTETNLTGDVVGESVGGFTEFFKNRVVLPFEGSYEQFRHVLHHEITHAVMLQFLYGTGSGAIIRGVSRMTPPLWFIEGLAEFESLGWDSDSDMFVRDATLRGYLPPIPFLQAFLAYKGGQAVFLYIEDTYGPQKRSEILQRIRSTRNFEQAWRMAFNEPLEESSAKWQRYMRKKYWPEIANRKEPADYAQALTNHLQWQNFVNNSPAVSPTGDRVAFLTDRSGFFDIYVVSATDPTKVEKLISGQRKADLEELHWLRPGMSWSPDAKYIAFSSRSGGEDALNIIDVGKKEIVSSFKFDLDGLFSPAWSPVSKEIAFVGMKNCCSHILVYNLDTKELRYLTRDIFSDLEPAWSPDGKQLIFTSDRKENVEPVELQGEVMIENHDYHTHDLYLINADGTGMRRLTNSPANDRYGQFIPDGKRVVYVSDKTGIANMYALDLETSQEQPVTDLLTGCAQLSWGFKSDRLAFTAFSNGGYNIYLWPNPLSNMNAVPTPQKTVFQQQIEAGRQIPSWDRSVGDAARVQRQVQRETDFSQFVFGADFRRGDLGDLSRSIKPVRLTSAQTREADGAYKTNPYKTKFTLDYIGVNAGYDPIFGLSGLTQAILSDQLGDHQIQIGVNLVQSIQNSDISLTYANLARRVNWSVSGFQFVNFLATNFGTVRFANRGLGVQALYPLTRFKRFDLGLQFIHISEDNLTFPEFFRGIDMALLVPRIAYTTDNTLPGYLGPIDGMRSTFGVSASPRFGAEGKQFVTGNFDVRRYYRLGREYSLALRLSGGASFGENPTLFVLGGVDNWLNRRFAENISLSSVEDYFLSDFFYPLRGADLYEQVGSRAALLNMEFRFPFIQYILARFPLPIGFQNILGAAFFDAGSAWSSSQNWRFGAIKADGSRYVRDIVSGFGYGIRANVYIFLLRFDAAWRTDFDKISSPRYYYSIGLDF